ncbi:hypothetical protein MCBB_0582 [Methanobacterium congolense]|uniref:Uncharacterized protein n=1 Tax=Methanobacterium congolense TaxID=118062 RepID=A0A1D3L0S8_9EURY|nr:hypothetical protein MCBB_0582 [Methanobacterium congolense]
MAPIFFLNGGYFYDYIRSNSYHTKEIILYNLSNLINIILCCIGVEKQPPET